MFQCDRCQKILSSKQRLSEHKKRKNKCELKDQSTEAGEVLYLALKGFTIEQLGMLLQDKNIIYISKTPFQLTDENKTVKQKLTEVNNVEQPINDNIPVVKSNDERDENKNVKQELTKNDFELKIQIENKKQEMIKEVELEYNKELKIIHNTLSMPNMRIDKINKLTSKKDKILNSLKKRKTLPTETPVLNEIKKPIDLNGIGNIDTILNYANDISNTITKNRNKAFDIAEKNQELNSVTTELLLESSLKMDELLNIKKALKTENISISLPTETPVNKTDFIKIKPEKEYIKIGRNSNRLTEHHIKLVNEYLENEGLLEETKDMTMKDKIIKHLPQWDSIFKNIYNIAYDME